MKTTFLTICATVLVIGLFAQAQPTNSSPDPKAGAETTGTIKEYTPDSILILDTLAPSDPGSRLNSSSARA